MQIIPVIDIRNGIAVRAIAGERSVYKPLVSQLTNSTEPAEVLKALQRNVGFSQCYVADLDAIERNAQCDAVPWPHVGRERSDRITNARNELDDDSSTPFQKARCSLAEMVRTGAKLIVDAGVRSVGDARELQNLGVDQIVVSSESLPHVSSLQAILESIGSDSLSFSIDLKLGQLLATDPTWRFGTPIDLIETIAGAGIRRVIILDLAAVGTGRGIPTLPLCRATKDLWPDLTVISGGGVRSVDCLSDAERAGIDGLLIASALHDGRIPSSGGC